MGLKTLGFECPLTLDSQPHNPWFFVFILETQFKKIKYRFGSETKYFGLIHYCEPYQKYFSQLSNLVKYNFEVTVAYLGFEITGANKKDFTDVSYTSILSM